MRSRFLLDTNVVIWMLAGDRDSLSAPAASVLEDPGNHLVLSAVSVWEIAIKRSLGKLRAPDGWFEEATSLDVESLPIASWHAKGVEMLPPHHRDPFDRLLISQALAERMPVITADARFAVYPVEVVW